MYVFEEEGAENKEREMASLSDGVAWTRQGDAIHTHTRENKKIFFLSQIFPFSIFCFKFRSVEFFTQFTTNFPFFFKKNYPVFFTENINEEKNIKFSSLACWLDFLKDYNTPVGRKS
jgi:hypothetical protein